jgi:hypothetical protein
MGDERKTIDVSLRIPNIKLMILLELLTSDLYKGIGNASYLEIFSDRMQI